MIKHALFAVLGLATAAHAERPRFLPDGSVRLGTQVFATTQDYVQSDAFRERGRCGSEPEAEVAGFAPVIAPTDCSTNQTLINPDYDDDRVFVIQVVFHVIKRTDGVGDITPALIQSQIDVLNEDFNALANTPGAAGRNAKVKFVLARFDPQGQPTTGIDIVTNDTYFEDPGSGGAPNPMKTALNWDPRRYLNIYTNDAAGLLGYATFPQQSAGTARDGVVVLWNSVGRNAPIGPPYNLGRTLTHEVGHYLGLFHTFQGGCGTSTAPYTSGDLIGDTIREQSPNYGCEPTASSCTAGQMNPIENYMDYSDDACMTKFTTEQANRLRCAIVNYRATQINTEPKALFTSSVVEMTATFTNTSTDLETPTQLRYNWTFGDGQTSTEQNPVHVYASAGSYEVTLEVVDPGSGANTLKQTVTVEAPPPPPGNDAGTDGGGGDGDGGGCCDAQGGATSSALLALPLVLVLRRRRRT